jgi:predicted DNA-binding transcriptional regulator YafY
MAKSSRDAAPLAGIMMMLFEQTSVTRSQLQEQFSVTERTVYRYLATLRDMGLIQLLEGETYLRTSAADLVIQSGLLRSFADFVDVSKFLPVGHGDFWRKLPARMDEKIISITGPASEGSVQHDLQRHFSHLEKAIREQRCCRITYKNQLRHVEPYRLFHIQGVWYLAATEQRQLKTFRLSGIEWLDVLPETFTPDPTINAILLQQKTPWCSQEQTTVTINVAPEVAGYFRQQAQLPEQELIESLTDGSLLLTTNVAHQKQLFPLIRFWLPHLRIVEPAEWQQQLEEEMKTVLVEAARQQTDSTEQRP